MKDPFAIIKSRHVTEKATMLQQLQTAKSNKSVARCQSPKYVFIVSSDANKQEIASAVEEIYREQKIKVAKVNTIFMKSKAKRRGRGRMGGTSTFKKAIVTLEPGDSLEK